jgi:iron complex transport system substrate-binding protein
MMAGGERIVSFLPSATEMVYALGLGDRLAGVTHECDWPPEAATKPVVVRSVLPTEQMTQLAIDEAVAARLRQGLSLYAVDEAAVQAIEPDLVLTQNLCEVCAPSGNEVKVLFDSLRARPEVLWLTPKNLDQIFDNIRDLGAATGREQNAAEVIAAGKQRLREIEAITSKVTRRPRVFCMEWMDPLYCSGHWVPEMVRIAGGIDELGRNGADSVRIPWQAVLDWQPETIVVMPCGFHLGKAFEEAQCLRDFPGWSKLPAVRNGRVYVVDANSYFARPGPRVVDGTQLLAHFIHPELVPWRGREAYRELEMPADAMA